MKKKIKIVCLVICVLFIGSFCYFDKGKVYKVDIPNYNQHQYGYPKGCEGVSLFMALKGKGYIQDMDIHSFMKTMPYSDESPEYGYMGDPRLSSKDKVNVGKRTTIYPHALSLWGSQFGNVESLEGQSIDVLKKELEQGNPIVVYMTSQWKEPKWGDFPFGKSVTNNHALCLVGYSLKTKEYLVNDCGQKNGTYWVDKELFEKIYNERQFAVVVR